MARVRVEGGEAGEVIVTQIRSDTAGHKRTLVISE